MLVEILKLFRFAQFGTTYTLYVAVHLISYLIQRSIFVLVESAQFWRDSAFVIRGGPFDILSGGGGRSPPKKK